MGPLYFTITKVFLQPLPLLLFVLGAGIINLWWKRKESRRRLLLVTTPFLGLLAASTPALIYPLLGTLEWRFPPIEGRPAGTEAIVVLAGGIMPPDKTRRETEPGIDTLYRCLLAAKLYQRGGRCPVIVTGGVLNPGTSIPPVAVSMHDLLVRLGVKDSDVLVEPNARTTYENAVETRKILQARGFGRVVLVTEAVHMERSLRCFHKQGVDAVPAACLHRATEFHLVIDSLIPSPGALSDLMAVAHEWLGLAWYRLTGKI